MPCEQGSSVSAVAEKVADTKWEKSLLLWQEKMRASRFAVQRQFNILRMRRYAISAQKLRRAHAHACGIAVLRPAPVTDLTLPQRINQRKSQKLPHHWHTHTHTQRQQKTNTELNRPLS